jgi:hypothetical protein
MKKSMAVPVFIAPLMKRMNITTTKEDPQKRSIKLESLSRRLATQRTQACKRIKTREGNMRVSYV